LIVDTKDGVVLIDTGWGDWATEQIVKWVRNNLHKKVILCVSTHFHADRIGGVQTLEKMKIHAICTPLTASLAKQHGVAAPEGILPNDTTFRKGDIDFECFYPGKGHAPDNIVVWLPQQKVLFGGCLVKSLDTDDIGNLSDASLSEWPQTIQTVKNKFPDAAIIIPGHQGWSSTKSLDHTIELVEKAKK